LRVSTTALNSSTSPGSTHGVGAVSVPARHPEPRDGDHARVRLPCRRLAHPRHPQAPRRQEHVLRLRGRVRAHPGRRARSGGAGPRDLQPRPPVGGGLPPERGRGARAHPTRGRVVRACVREAARGLVLPLWTEHADAQAARRGRRVRLRLGLVQRRSPVLHGGRGPSASGRALRARCERHRVLAGQRHGHGRAVRDLPARFVRCSVRRVRALPTDDVDRAPLPRDRTAGPLALARPVHRLCEGVRRRLVPPRARRSPARGSGRTRETRARRRETSLQEGLEHDGPGGDAVRVRHPASPCRAVKIPFSASSTTSRANRSVSSAWPCRSR
jgi:hypothetical protein